MNLAVNCPLGDEDDDDEYSSRAFCEPEMQVSVPEDEEE